MAMAWSGEPLATCDLAELSTRRRKFRFVEVRGFLEGGLGAVEIFHLLGHNAVPNRSQKALLLGDLAIWAFAAEIALSVWFWATKVFIRPLRASLELGSRSRACW